MDEERIETLKYAHKARAEVFTFFDKFFRLLPDEEFFNMVERNLPYLKEISEGGENEDMREGLSQLEDFFIRKASLGEKARSQYCLEALRRYTTLFCLTDSVPMTESYYTSQTGHSMGGAYGEVRKIMRKYGFRRPADVNEYEDHISVESAFMAGLAFASADMLEKNNIEDYGKLVDEQYAFYENHFDKWVNIFVGVVLAHPVSEVFFKAMAKFLRGFLKEDKQLLSEAGYTIISKGDRGD